MTTTVSKTEDPMGVAKTVGLPVKPENVGRRLMLKPKTSKPPFQNITPCGMFATPKDMKALEDYCARFTGPGERVIALTVMGMTWNLAAKVRAENIKNYPLPR